MEKIKLTKSDLRKEQIKIAQLQRYLPTLQLKKSLLQAEVNATKAVIDKIEKELILAKQDVERFCDLLTLQEECDVIDFSKVRSVEKSYENIAGVDIPSFENTVFNEANYFLFDTPTWMDGAISKLRNMMNVKERIKVEEEKKGLLEKELRDVSIRVNLFEKILIPRTEGNIKKIKIFLGDQELAAVSQAKVAKAKILMKTSK
jgi:V/A-type H+/Na+-transporting ATPase subunit D